MVSKKIAHTVMKKLHSLDNNPVTHNQQKQQDKLFNKSGEHGRGIHIGSLMDFQASSGYNSKKQTEGDKPVHQRKADVNHQPQDKSPAHLHEKNPHHLFRCDCDRKDAKEIQQN